MLQSWFVYIINQELKKYSEILYNGARLIEGLTIENPTEFSNDICELISE